MKRVFGVVFLLWGGGLFLSALVKLPGSLPLFESGNYARAGAETGGIVFGPVIFLIGIMLWRSASKAASDSTADSVSADARVDGASDAS